LFNANSQSEAHKTRLAGCILLLFFFAASRANSQGTRLPKDPDFTRLKVKVGYSYSFVKEFHWLTVIPVNTGQMQGPIVQ
jgi:hypothetical protein